MDLTKATHVRVCLYTHACAKWKQKKNKKKDDLWYNRADPCWKVILIQILFCIMYPLGVLLATMGGEINCFAMIAAGLYINKESSFKSDTIELFWHCILEFIRNADSKKNKIYRYCLVNYCFVDRDYKCDAMLAKFLQGVAFIFCFVFFCCFFFVFVCFFFAFFFACFGFYIESCRFILKHFAFVSINLCYEKV